MALKSCVDAPVDARGLLAAPAMIGCGHVSGLEVRLCHMPRASMEIRRPGADQNCERLKLVDPNCFSWPRPVRSVCPYRSSTSSSPTHQRKLPADQAGASAD